jgi:hypothetical protein
MICTQCKKSYLSVESAAGAAPSSLFGLCEACGSSPRFGAFASSLGAGATLLVLSLEFAALSWLFQGWVFFAIAVGTTATLYGALILIARRGSRVRYRTSKERQRGEWSQRLLGSTLGFVIGMGWFWLAVTWGHTR